MSAPTVGPPPRSIADLAERFAGSAVVVDVDELVATIEAAGISDKQAQVKYGVPTVFALGEAVLAQLWARRGQPGALPPRRVMAPFARAALARAALFLTPALAAIASDATLDRVGWPLLAITLVLGWSGGQALACAGYARAGHGATGAALRRLGLGLLVGAAGCGVVVALGPGWLVGSRAVAYPVCGVVLVAFAAVAAALIGDRVGAVLRWSVPVWGVSLALLAGMVPPWALGAAVGLAAARAFAPALRRDPPGARVPVRTPVGAMIAYLLVGAGQAGAFLLVSRLEPGAGAAAVPLLLAVPLIELFVGWHAAGAAAGLDLYDDVAAYRRHLRALGVVTLAALVPPLAIGAALVVAAFRLPYELSRHPDARALVLSAAAGVLLAGAWAATLLLATRGRLVLAALLALAPVAFAVAPVAGLLVAVPTGGADSLIQVLLPATVAGLAATSVLGLAATAHTVFHSGSYR
ncbi:hypothetical protein Ais01nite_51880 [Asanoa ishikariensis]|uniref:Uncharacterized protein n=1 Tax=Asanoa ishikariensis TaxID=137265 RepID=A0A1H3RJ74_9ACTN|nr:hypothetical protein [Asanoa ishikariensis]GIF67153.1 hypothetical protein Ais01nite_51880 [Asanoa ishikariensis]SDZ25812.1 hypothetical protein SAMN05421684_3890 [Asanoa ishikariensis]